MVVPVVAPMHTREPTQVGSRLVRGDRAFTISRDCGNIVIHSRQGQLPKVKEASRNVSLAQHPSLFEVAVSDVPGTVCGRDDACLDVRREGGLPQSGGGCPGANTTPPIPALAASTAPMAEG
jgi:hypothetical protein